MKKLLTVLILLSLSSCDKDILDVKECNDNCLKVTKVIQRSSYYQLEGTDICSGKSYRFIHTLNDYVSVGNIICKDEFNGLTEI
jgi:hypothetical protein